MSQFDPNSELLAKAEVAQQEFQRTITEYFDWLLQEEPRDTSGEPPNAAIVLLYELQKKILQHIKSYEAEGSSWADGMPTTEDLKAAQDESTVADFEIYSGLREIEKRAGELVTILDHRDFRLVFNRYSLQYQLAYLSVFTDGLANSDAGKNYLMRSLVLESDDSELPIAHIKRITRLEGISFREGRDDIPRAVAEYFHNILPGLLVVFNNPDDLAHLLLDFLELYIPGLSERVPEPDITGAYLDDVLDFIYAYAELDSLDSLPFAGPVKETIRNIISFLNVVWDGRKLSQDAELLPDRDYWVKVTDDAWRATLDTRALGLSLSDTGLSGLELLHARRDGSKRAIKLLKLTAKFTALLDVILSIRTLSQELEEGDEYSALGAGMQVAGGTLSLLGAAGLFSTVLGSIGFFIGSAGLIIYVASEGSELALKRPERSVRPEPSVRSNLELWFLTNWFGRLNGVMIDQTIPPFGSYYWADVVKQIDIFYSMLLPLNIIEAEWEPEHEELSVTIEPALVTAGVVAKVELLHQDGSSDLLFDGPTSDPDMFTFPDIDMSGYQEQRLRRIYWGFRTPYQPVNRDQVDGAKVKVSVSWKIEAADRRIWMPFTLTEIKTVEMPSD
jgi:hypothetical protein